MKNFEKTPCNCNFEEQKYKETIEDYVRWRGDLTFADSPFNMIDSMVLCELSYVDFSQAVPQNDSTGKSLTECCDVITEKGVYRLCNLYGGHEDFFKAVSHSKRFGSILLKNYREVFDSTLNAQFAAMEFGLSPRVSYLAFRGTDNSIVGWREDFMLSFTRISSQDYARQYLQDTIKFGGQYYIGGHSKGGNLAMYAAAWLTSKQLKQVIQIFDLDGPGFAPETFDLTKIQPLMDKTIKLTPEFCMIGKVFELELPNTCILKSTEMGVNQHDLISWQVNGLDLYGAKEHDKISEWMDKTIMEWVEEASNEDRQQFVDDFFNALVAGGAKTMQEVTGKGLLEVIKAMASASPTSRKMVAELAEIAILGDIKKKTA